MLMVVALVGLCRTGIHAQGAGAGQKPPDAQTRPAAQTKPDAQAQAKDTQAKPADTKAPELTAAQKAFNSIAEEKDAQKRIPQYEKFIEDNPKEGMLVSLARTEIQRSTLATLKSSSTKYLDIVKKEIDSAKTGTSPTQLPSTYSRFASALLSAGVLLDEAEDFARQSVSLLDEQKYIESQKQMDQRVAESFAKRAANPTPAPATPPPTGVTGISIRTVNGAPTVQPMPPRPASASTPPPRPPTPPRARTDEELRNSFNSMRAANLATLGRVLMKRNKTAEGEKVLKEAYAAKPPASTLATIAKVLADSAKKAGDTAAQFEYLTVLALSGRITADEQKDFEALYRKSHNGSLDGLEAMLDARYARENPRFAVTPANRKPAPNQRAVLAENFTGSG
jgi:hypothetical protein